VGDRDRRIHGFDGEAFGATAVGACGHLWGRGQTPLFPHR
jgi:hypothetical protein